MEQCQSEMEESTADVWRFGHTSNSNNFFSEYILCDDRNCYIVYFKLEKHFMGETQMEEPYSKGIKQYMENTY